MTKSEYVIIGLWVTASLIEVCGYALWLFRRQRNGLKVFMYGLLMKTAVIVGLYLAWGKR